MTRLQESKLIGYHIPLALNELTAAAYQIERGDAAQGRACLRRAKPHIDAIQAAILSKVTKENGNVSKK